MGAPSRAWLEARGLGIDYDPAGDVPSPAELAAGVAAPLDDRGGTLITEPGRAVAGRCGVLLTRVVVVRERGGRWT